MAFEANLYLRYERGCIPRRTRNILCIACSICVGFMIVVNNEFCGTASRHPVDVGYISLQHELEISSQINRLDLHYKSSDVGLGVGAGSEKGLPITSNACSSSSVLWISRAL